MSDAFSDNYKLSVLQLKLITMKSIVFQGITSKNHLSALKHVLEIDCPQRVIISVAFMNAGGVSLVSEALKPVTEQSTILAGIRNGITSRQGLEAVLELGCSIYAVDTGQRQLIFHPKIYMSRNLNEARLVVGSANLTRGGLCENIEASVILDLELDNPDDSGLFMELEKQIDGMIAKYPKNVLPISSRSDIERLLDTGRVIDEARDSRSTTSDSRHEQDSIPPMKLRISHSAVSKSETMNNRDISIPKQVEFIIPLQVALRELGGSGTNDEIYECVVQIMQLSEDQLNLKDMGLNRSKIKNQLGMAKKQLKIWQYIDGTPKGNGRYWLTEKGHREDITDPQALLGKPGKNVSPD